MEKEFKIVIDNVPAVLFKGYLGGTVNFYDSKIETMTGYSKEEFGSRRLKWTDLILEEDRNNTKMIFIQALKTNKAYVREYRITSREGKIIWIHERSHIVCDQNGKVEYVSGLFFDITDRKQLEDGLRRAERDSQIVRDNIPAVLFKGYLDGSIESFNGKTETMTGYPKEEFESRRLKWADLILEEDRNQTRQIFIQALKTNKAYIREYRIRAKAGNVIWVHERSLIVCDAEGKVEYVSGLFFDITERKRAKEELKEKDKFMESIVQSSAVATFVVDAEHKVIYWNKACEDLTGIKSEDLLGTSDHWEAFYDHPRPCVADVIIDNKFNEMTNLYKVYARSVLIPDGIRAEGWYPNLGGKNRYIVFDAAPIRGDNGKLIAAIETLQDITERKQAEEKLLQTLESLRKAFGTTVQVMVSVVEARDPYTAGHQLRSADLARAIATEMGSTQDRIDGIRMAGSIHDIGKLSIPAEILSKPAKLTNNEFSLIKEHPQRGYEILKDVESPWPLAEIVYQHHERMDGSGYPRNLKGDDILMEARIMAVADVVEAMASHRPYRPGLGINAALEEIEKNRGTHYDNTVADACLRLFREKGFQLKST